MSTTTTKTCRIQFFELVVGPDDKRISGHDWQGALTKLQALNRGHVCDYHGTQLEGLVIGTDGTQRSLSLGVDRATTPRQRNTTKPERREMELSGTDWEPVEESFVVFFPNNIIGMVRSTNSAPTHAAVARWVNEFCRPTGQDRGAYWRSKPIIDEEKYRQIVEMGGTASSVTFAVRPATISTRGLLSGLFDGISDKQSGLKIEVKVTADRGHAGDAARRDILGMAIEGVDLHENGFPFEKAKTTFKPSNGGRTEEIDFLEHKLTRQVEIPVTKVGTARSLSESVILREIRTAFTEMQHELHASIGLTQRAS